MSQFSDWFQLYPGNTTTTTTTANRRRKVQKLRQALWRITNIMQRRLLAEARTKKSKREKDFFEDFFTSAFSSSKHSLGFLTTPGPMSTVPTVEVDSNICDDIRGRDRACCNSAVACFDDLQTSIDDIGQAGNDFTLLSACRKVSSELKKDKQCVKQAVSRCDGPGRALLLRRFDNRINKLYNQFYRHCTPDALWSTTTSVATTTTTTTTTRTVQEPETVTNGSSWEPPNTKIPPPPTLSGLPGDHHPTVSGHFPKHGGDSANTTTPTSGGSIAIIAGAVAGGIILIIVLLIALILWCRSRDKMYDSNSTSSSSAGIFFQKRPNLFSTDRPRPAGKRGVKRQESSEYAEIDERFMNLGFRGNQAPPLPEDPPLPGYIRPISEAGYTEAHTTDLDIRPSPPGTPDSLKGLGFSAPPFATRGQLKYGPILAANANGQPPLYHLSASSPNSHHRLGNITEDNRTNETVLSAESFDEDDYLAPSSGAGSANRYITMEMDPYERPNSATPSVNYDQLEHETNDKDASQVTPREDSGKPHKHSAVKVLPSIPLTVPSGNNVPSEDSDNKPEPQGPVAKPRRTKGPKAEPNDTEVKVQSCAKDKEETNNHAAVSTTKSNSSTNSNTSSHHYFVLEPNLV